MCSAQRGPSAEFSPLDKDYWNGVADDIAAKGQRVLAFAARSVMITGDHAGTATAIGRQIGLRNPDKVLTGGDLDRLDDQALALAVIDTDIFARTSPEHKLRLVMAL